MNPHIRVSHEQRRGCGFRKVGGLYLVCEGPGAECGNLPLPLGHCPVCTQGIKPARGWTWIEPPRLFQVAPACCAPHALGCARCPVGGALPERAGLLWVGEAFYATPSDFDREAQELGISRRIPALPRGFEAGKTWVFLAHRSACASPDPFGGDPRPGVFRVFRPTAVEQVVTGTEPDEQIEALVKRGITPVVVHPINGAGEQMRIDDAEAEAAEAEAEA